MCPRAVIIQVLVVCTGALSPEVIEKLRQDMESTRECRHVIGLSASVVRSQEIIFSEGFGMADLASRTPVAGDTPLAIGSLTKAFTVELLTQLLSEQDDTSFTWDTPIKDILGDSFQMTDEIRTDHVTLGDLLAHKLGVPAYFLPLQVGYPENVTLHELVRRIRYMCPTTSFREKFMYNNYMYALAGYIAEKLAGDVTWEELIRQRIFGALGMTRSGFVSSDPSPEGLAKPYTRIDGEPVAVPLGTLRAVYPAGPAGSIASSANDMARWMNYLLVRDPRTDDQSRMAAYKPQMAVYMPAYEALRRPAYPVAWFGQAYGYAWWFTNYRGKGPIPLGGDVITGGQDKGVWQRGPSYTKHKGYSTMQHPGGISTFTSQLVLIPDAQVGVYMANNGPAHPETTSAMRAIMMYLLDHALGLAPWLNASTLCSYPQPWDSEYAPVDPPSPDEHESNIAADETPNDVSLQTYTGVYGHPGFGHITVYVNETDSHLHVKYGRLGRAKLYQSRDLTVFTWVWYGHLRYDTTDIQIKFDNHTTNSQATIMVVPVDVEGRIFVDFKRDYVPSENDPSTYYCSAGHFAHYSHMHSLQSTVWSIGLMCALIGMF